MQTKAEDGLFFYRFFSVKKEKIFCFYHVAEKICVLYVSNVSEVRGKPGWLLQYYKDSVFFWRIERLVFIVKYTWDKL